MRLLSQDFESCASASSATAACKFICLGYFKHNGRKNQSAREN